MTLNRKRAADPYGEEEEGGSRERRVSGGGRFFFYLLAIAAVLLLFVVLVARSAGFRELVSVKNEEWTQTRAGIGGSHLALPCDLVLTEVAVPDTPRADRAGLRIPEVRLSWRPGKGLQVRMVRPDVRLIRSPEGESLPVELSRLGSLRNAADVTEWLASLQGRATLRIEQGTLEVVDPGGTRLLRMEGIGLSATPVRLPGRLAVYYDLGCGPMAGPDGGFEKRSQAWLAWDGTNRVDMRVEAAGAKTGDFDFWKGTQP